MSYWAKDKKISTISTEPEVIRQFEIRFQQEYEKQGDLVSGGNKSQ